MTFNLICGDWLKEMRKLPDASVQMCVTSPPYWGLRDYGTATWDGGDQNCAHRAPDEGGKSGNKGNTREHPGRFIGESCYKCGALRIDTQLGNERTPEEYLAKLVVGFRELRRILAKDGTLWLNLGDAYANDYKWGGATGGKHRKSLHGTQVGRAKRKTGLKPKDLIGIPWMVAFALRGDGWWLRSEIIWSKPNPMVESMKDRPTRSHEQIFLLAKSQRYYCNMEAIKEPQSFNERQRRLREQRQGLDSNYALKRDTANGQVAPGKEGALRSVAARHELAVKGTRNKRTVWNISPSQFKGAHTATFPPKLVEPCVLAGSQPGQLVIDPFSGAGTTGLVALRLGRSYIGIDNNPMDIATSEARILGDQPLFNKANL